MASLYTNENIPAPLTEHLRVLGHDVVTVLQDSRAHQGIEDDVILARATLLGRAVVTLNRFHFRRLHRGFPLHAGIILCTADDPERLAARIDTKIRDTNDLVGQLIEAFKPSR